MGRKSNDTLNKDQVARLSALLESLKQTNAGYPVTAQRLLELAEMEPKWAEALSASSTSRPFASTAKSNAKGPAARQALILLRRDVALTATAPELLESTLRAKVTSTTQMYTVAQLAAGFSRQFQLPFKQKWSEAVSSRAFPPGVGMLKMRGTAYLFPLEQLGIAPRAVALVQNSVTSCETTANQTSPSETTVKPTFSNGASGDRNEASLTTDSRAHSAAVAPPSSDAQSKRLALSAVLLQTFDRLNSANGGQNYVTLRDLRNELAVARGEFDSALHQLRRDRVLSLDAADGRHERVDPSVLEAAIVEDGRRLVYVQRRMS